MKHFRATTVVLSAILAAVAAACSDSGTEPEVEFQVIEEVEFAPSLGIDLASMTKLQSGVYYQDLVVGTGDTLFYGSFVTADYTGWLYTGVQFDQGQDLTYVAGNSEVIPGFEQGMLQMLEGGKRKIIVPPALGYGSTSFTGVPAGSILVFEVTLKDIS